MKIKEFTVSQSIKLVKDMLKNKSLKVQRDSIKPGELFFGVYDAKDKEQTYDKRPFVLLLKRNKTHMLGINFNWAPLPLRVILVKKILQMNSRNIKNNKPLEFYYKDLKPFLKKIGFAPVIRMYISKRMSSSVIKVKPENLLEASRINSAVFNEGKSAETMYRKAIKGNKEYRATRKRRE